MPCEMLSSFPKNNVAFEQQTVFCSYLPLFARVGLLGATVTNDREEGGLIIRSEKCYRVRY